MTFWQLIFILLILGFGLYALYRWGTMIDSGIKKIIYVVVIIVAVVLVLNAFGIFNLFPNVPMPRVH